MCYKQLETTIDVSFLCFFINFPKSEVFREISGFRGGKNKDDSFPSSTR
jgi:hypothetical protein